MAAVDKQSVHTGNTVYFMIKNKPIARASSLTSQRSFGTQGVYQIGSIMPQEHVYLRYEGSVSVERFRMKRESLVDLGFGALGEEILKMDILDIILYDNATKSVIIAYRGCSLSEISESVQANEIMSENATFMYLTASSVQ